uniref:Gag-polyprotein putative aspartyl protease n=1 Tax=Candidatus Kentrum sp. FW TaxID=2126338 RepID=A0A450SRQ7_9GAMM|nr:MAG: gag-polyprotein putative aspartyl protease [Candidatus Kentron sp. FW]
MGTFYTDFRIENHQNAARSIPVPRLLVDSGAEHTWIREDRLKELGILPLKKNISFIMANGKPITRHIGFMVIRVGDAFTVDEVVFAQQGDLELLGARSLEGLNLMVDAKRKKLVSAGPYPVAWASASFGCIQRWESVEQGK